MGGSKSVSALPAVFCTSAPWTPPPLRLGARWGRQLRGAGGVVAHPGGRRRGVQGPAAPRAGTRNNSKCWYPLVVASVALA
eukprot:4639027-Alexandrium_andersonii.AAC.1